MEPVRVLIVFNFPDDLLRRLRDISPRLVVTQCSASSVEEVPASLWSEAEVLYTHWVLPDPRHAPRLQWVQLHAAGINRAFDTPLWRSDVMLTTTSGVHAISIGEWVFTMMLAFSRQLRVALEFQTHAEWARDVSQWPARPRELWGATVGIIGYGSIGQEIGRRARAFGMRVLGLRRGKSRGSRRYVLPELIRLSGQEPDLLYSSNQLSEMLPECDYVVLSTPYTDSTHHLIDEQALRAMRSSAVLINVSRGSVVDEMALIRALREGWIAGAALDVFEQEPLRPDSPLWRMNNVIVTPHIAGWSPHYESHVTDLFAENLRRYLAGESLLNLVNREWSY